MNIVDFNLNSTSATELDLSNYDHPSSTEYPNGDETFWVKVKESTVSRLVVLAGQWLSMATTLQRMVLRLTTSRVWVSTNVLSALSRNDHD
jgi:hypothetical protein